MCHTGCLEVTSFRRSREKRKAEWKGLGSISRFHCFELADHKAYPFCIRMIQSCAEFSMVGLVFTGVTHCQQHPLISLSAPVVVALNSVSIQCDRHDPQNRHRGVFVRLCMYCMRMHVGRLLHIQSSCVRLSLAWRLAYDLGS